MTQRRHGRADPEGDNKSRRPGHSCTLTPFGQFRFFEVTFKHFCGDGLLRHAAYMFGIHEVTARRYYDSWVLATGRFFDGQQHPATMSKAFAATASSIRQSLCLGPKYVIFLGDCTERWTNDPQDGALHSALYSSYKSHTTIKYLPVQRGTRIYCTSRGRSLGRAWITAHTIWLAFTTYYVSQKRRPVVTLWHHQPQLFSIVLIGVSLFLVCLKIK
jgi:hypothetical protein